MLAIRPEQMLAFQEAQANRFAHELVPHIRKFAPLQFKIIGEEAVGRTACLGVKNARDYGFTLRGPARLYVELMFMFGSFFDTDPQYQSVTVALRDDQDTDEMGRADRLHEDATEYVQSVSGPQHEYERAALARAAELQYEQVTALAGRPTQDLIGMLRHLYPEKCQHMGEAAAAALVDEAKALAAKRGPSWLAGGPLFLGLMFTFGHGCFADPQFPWISDTLDAAAPRGAASALEGLFRKFSLYLDRAKTNLKVG